MIKPFKANAIFSAVLIAFGLWAFMSVAPDNRSVTILIPVIFGVLLALCTPWFKLENKVASHIVVLLTCLICLALIMPLIGSIGRADPFAITRVSVMMLTGIICMVIYIKSFIDIRRARNATQ